MKINIDHLDALEELQIARDLLNEFLDTIYNSLDGDHPDREEVRAWLDRMEQRREP